MSSFILTRAMADEIVNSICLPGIHACMDANVTNKDQLHIVVLDPTKPFSPEQNFEEAFLYEKSIESQKWRRDYKKIARSKAEICWRTGLSSHIVQQRNPYLYQIGDAPFAGGVVHEGLVIACSGVQSWFDQMFAYWIAAALQARCIEQMQIRHLPEDKDFLGR